jgi:peroxidase
MLKGADGACRDTNVKVKCFIGGEGRTNENLGLVSIQTLFLRMHNKLAKQLSTLNPHWNDELIYHETRRIIIAFIQHITYSEYLPVIIGVKTATSFDLIPKDDNTFYTGYDTNVNPSMANEFTTAAFRFGHSMIRNQYSRADQTNKKFAKINLSDMIFRPVEAYK